MRYFIIAILLLVLGISLGCGGKELTGTTTESGESSQIKSKTSKRDNADDKGSNENNSQPEVSKSTEEGQKESEDLQSEKPKDSSIAEAENIENPFIEEIEENIDTKSKKESGVGEQSSQRPPTMSGDENIEDLVQKGLTETKEGKTPREVPEDKASEFVQLVLDSEKADEKAKVTLLLSSGPYVVKKYVDEIYQNVKNVVGSAAKNLAKKVNSIDKETVDKSNVLYAFILKLPSTVKKALNPLFQKPKSDKPLPGLKQLVTNLRGKFTKEEWQHYLDRKNSEQEEDSTVIKALMKISGEGEERVKEALLYDNE